MQESISCVILGLIQGLTEFLPVSSTGHLIVARDLFGIATTNGLAIDAVLQLATALAVVVYFSKDLLRLFYSAVSLMFQKSATPGDGRLLLALAIGTVPAVICGIFLESSMETIFRSGVLVAYTLLAGSVVMLLAEWVGKKRVQKNDLSTLSPLKALGIGLFQSLALIPGMSRSGMTISGGLLFGLSRENAARFGFLLSIPIILGSGLKKLFELGFDGTLSAIGPELALGFLVSFISGLAAIHVLLLFVRTQPLYIFVAYRVLLALFIFIGQ